MCPTTIAATEMFARPSGCKSRRVLRKATVQWHGGRGTHFAHAPHCLGFPFELFSVAPDDDDPAAASGVRPRFMSRLNYLVPL